MLIAILLPFLLALLFLGLWLRERQLLRRRIQDIFRRLADFETQDIPYEPLPTEDAWTPLDQSLSRLTRHVTLQKQQSDRQSRQTARLIADIAHQWKTPLSSLKLYCELSLQEEPDSREKKKLLLVERMETMIESLLRLEKLNAGSYEMQFCDQDIQPLIAEICQDLSLLYPDRKFILPQEPFVLRIDPYWLREALTNVLKNACQHTPAGSTVQISWKATEPYHWIIVEDTGGGVPEETLSHLFDRFYRTTTQGAGLGLPIARAICRNHHGDIFAENAPHGLRVCLLFPQLASDLRQSTD